MTVAIEADMIILILLLIKLEPVVVLNWETFLTMRYIINQVRAVEFRSDQSSSNMTVTKKK